MSTHSEPVDPDHQRARRAARHPGDLALLLGEAYHPGGPSRRLFTALNVQPGHRLVDVAAGVGTTALLAASEYDVAVDGIDLAAGKVALAAGASAARGLDDRPAFRLREPRRAPLPDARYDAAFREFALRTFPDKATVLGEMSRVLRPGGRVRNNLRAV